MEVLINKVATSEEKIPVYNDLNTPYGVARRQREAAERIANDKSQPDELRDQAHRSVEFFHKQELDTALGAHAVNNSHG